MSHTYGTITDTVDIIGTQERRHLNTLEEHHVYKITKKYLTHERHKH
jgi:hypothetical protein